MSDRQSLETVDYPNDGAIVSNVTGTQPQNGVTGQYFNENTDEVLKSTQQLLNQGNTSGATPASDTNT